MLRHLTGGVARAARIMRNPAAAWERFFNRLDRKIEYARAAPVYRAEPDWERRLHDWIDVGFPCDAASEFRALWPEVAARVAAQGVDFGPRSFYGWNDADPELVRALWCIVRHRRPATVVETGVAHGITTRFLLEALERNGYGRLWSIDPPPVEPHRAREIGIAVDGSARRRWQLVRGTSRRMLPALLAELGRVDLFIHDSLHTKRNVCFEVAQAVQFMPPGGLVVIDDIDTNWGFDALSKRHRASFLVCQSEPVRPDPRRFDDKGVFGIMRLPA